MSHLIKQSRAFAGDSFLDLVHKFVCLAGQLIPVHFDVSLVVRNLQQDNGASHSDCHRLAHLYSDEAAEPGRQGTINMEKEFKRGRWETHHPEAAPTTICWVADFLVMSPRNFCTALSTSLFLPVLLIVLTADRVTHVWEIAMIMQWLRSGG